MQAGLGSPSSPYLSCISSVSSISNNINLIGIYVNNSNSNIIDVSNNTNLIKIFISNNTANDTNNILDTLINTPRVGLKEMLFDYNAAIDQSKVTTLVTNGWDITQDGQP